MNNYDDLSTIEALLMTHIADQAMAIEMLGAAVRQHLPATDGLINNVIENLRNNSRNIHSMQTARFLEGRGPMATHLRRTLELDDTREMSAGAIDSLISEKLPHRWSDKSDAREYIEYVWRMFGRLEFGTHSTDWVADTYPASHPHRELCLKDLMNQTDAIASYSAIHERHPGLYWEASYSNYGAKKRFLIVKIDDRTFVTVHETRDVNVWSYVDIERCWVRHQDLRYVGFQNFVHRFHETFRERAGLWPAALTQQEFIDAVRKALVETPIKQKTKEEWQDLIHKSGSDWRFGYREMNQAEDFNDRKVLISQQGNSRLTFRFDDVNGDQLDFQLVDDKPSHHMRFSQPVRVNSWADLPLWNKITLAKDLLDTIARVHNNENRPAVEEPSSEPTTET